MNIIAYLVKVFVDPSIWRGQHRFRYVIPFLGIVENSGKEHDGKKVVGADLTPTTEQILKE